MIFALFLTRNPITATVIKDIVLALISISFVASANYVINEWLDAEFEKFHPTKKNRPVVSGNLKFHWVMGALGLLIVVAAMILCRFWCIYRTKE